MNVLFIMFSLPLINAQHTWNKTGSKPADYYLGPDTDLERNGQAVNTFKSIVEEIDGFGGVVNSILPGEYLGKRLKMTGLVKTKDIAEWAGLWLRVDSKDKNISLSFDNMKDGKTDRSIKGTNDWSKYEIVLDVPAEATKLVYGLIISGTGQLWFDEVNFELVDKSIPTTGYLSCVHILYDKISREGLKETLAYYESLKKDLNLLGYKLLDDKNTKDAIEVFKLNIKDNPASANAFDSLGEAYYIAGDTDNAIKYFEKALEINPELASSINMLKKIRK